MLLNGSWMEAGERKPVERWPYSRTQQAQRWTCDTGQDRAARKPPGLKTAAGTEGLWRKREQLPSDAEGTGLGMMKYG
jgi:hypothetical protein